jgi:hypothetical protein
VNDIWLVTACPEAHADRLAAMLASLAHDPHRTVVVTSRHHDRLHPDHVGHAWYWTDRGEDFSLARLWNHGLRLAYEAGATEVAVFSTDVTGHPGSLTRLRDSMRVNNCTMAGPNLYGPDNMIMAGTDRTTIRRVPGGCYLIAAEHRLLCDESYRWWYSDDDLETQAREIGPVGVFTGTGLLMGPDSALTDERAAWATEDRAHYVAKWGREPW